MKFIINNMNLDNKLEKNFKLLYKSAYEAHIPKLKKKLTEHEF